MVLQTMPPQPRSYDLAITRALVPGGPDPRTNGLSNFIPLTTIARLVDVMAATTNLLTTRKSRRLPLTCADRNANLGECLDLRQYAGVIPKATGKAGGS